jgi:hypothetical protein
MARRRQVRIGDLKRKITTVGRKFFGDLMKRSEVLR